MKSVFRYVTGAPADDPTRHTIQALCFRISDSKVHKYDRRDAVVELRSKVVSHLDEVGKEGIPALIKLLNEGRRDPQTTMSALEILIAATTEEELPLEQVLPEEAAKLKEQIRVNTDRFIKHPEGVATLMSILGDEEFHVRHPTVRLLTHLLASQTKELQESVMSNPTGIASLIEALGDKHEALRNEVLLLLRELTQSHPELQKVVVFHNIFTSLFDIIEGESSLDGGVVVQDCLQLMTNLLRDNVLSRNFFRETGDSMNRLAGLLAYQPQSLTPAVVSEPVPTSTSQPGTPPSAVKSTATHTLVDANCIRVAEFPHGQSPEDETLPPDVKSSALLAIEIVRLLVESTSTNGPQTQNQTQAHRQGVTKALLQMSINFPVLQPQALWAVGEILRGNINNQQTLDKVASVLLPGVGMIPGSSWIIAAAINGQSNVAARAFHALHAFLINNSDGQIALASSLADPQSYLRQILFGALFSEQASPSRQRRAATCFARIIDNSNAAREAALRVAYNKDVTLLSQMMKTLRGLSRDTKEGSVDVRPSFLYVLCCWLRECHVAVNAFLSSAAHLPSIVSYAETQTTATSSDVLRSLAAIIVGLCLEYNDESTTVTRDMVLNMIQHRIGLDEFFGNIQALKTYENFRMALQKDSELAWLDADDNLGVGFSHDFATFASQFVDSIESRVLSLYTQPKTPTRSGATMSGAGTPSAEGNAQAAKEYESVIQSLQDIVRTKENQLRALKKENETLTTRNQELEQKESHYQSSTIDKQEHERQVSSLANESKRAVSESIQLRAKVDALSLEIRSRDEKVKTIEEELRNAKNEVEMSRNEAQGMSQQYVEFERMLLQKDAELENLRKQLKGSSAVSTPVKVDDGELKRAKQHVQDLEAQLREVRQEKSSLEKQVADLQAKAPETTVDQSAQAELESARAQIATLTAQKEATLAEAASMAETLEEAEKKRDAAQHEATRLLSELSLARERHIKDSEVMESTQNQLSTAQRQLEALREEFKHVNEAKVQAASVPTNAEVEDSLRASVKELEQQVADLTAKLTAAETRASQLEAEHKEVKAKLDETMSEHSDLVTEHNDLLEYLAELNEKVDDLQGKVDKYEAKQ